MINNNLNHSMFEKEIDILKGSTILIVDNDYNILVLMSEIFESYGTKVFMALSAIAAFEIIEKSPVDLLISDINMSGEDGYWLIRKIRELICPKTRKIPAVAFTASAEYQIGKKIIDAGFQTYIQKPVGLMQLVTEITTLLKSSV